MSSGLPTVKLRALEPEDLEMLYTIENNQSEWNVGATNVPYSRYVLRDYIANTASDIYADRQLRLMVDNGSGETVSIAGRMMFKRVMGKASFCNIYFVAAVPVITSMVSPRLTIALLSNVNHSPSATGSIYKSLAKVVVSSMVSVYLPIQP